jgi:hypothetical protein
MILSFGAVKIKFSKSHPGGHPIFLVDTNVLQGFIKQQHPVHFYFWGTLRVLSSRVSIGHGVVICQGLSSLALDNTWSHSETSSQAAPLVGLTHGP